MKNIYNHYNDRTQNSMMLACCLCFFRHMNINKEYLDLKFIAHRIKDDGKSKMNGIDWNKIM